MKKLLMCRALGRSLMLVIALVTGLSALTVADGQALPAGVVDGGVVAASTPVQLTLYLAPDAGRTAALVQFLTDVQTPGATSYHQWISAKDFATRFGVSDAQVARVNAFASAAGLTVGTVSGLRIEISGTAAQVEQVFAPGLHDVVSAGQMYVVSTQTVVLPAELQGDVVAVDGMSTLPGVADVALFGDGVAVAPSGRGALEDLATSVEANKARVLGLSTAACTSDVPSAKQTAMQNLLREAAAQGMTVLATSGCATGGAASFPAVLPEVTAVAVAPGVSAELGAAAFVRPAWQDAVGLPADLLRHEPDVTVSSLSALSATMEAIVAAAPANVDGSAGRVGNVAKVLYELAPMPRLYTQPDAATTGLTGNWETATGLGVVNLPMLQHAFPNGTQAVYIQVNTVPLYATHGQSVTFTAAIKDISGAGATSPSGTVTFTTDSGVTLGTATLTSTGSVSSSASVSYNALPTGGFNVIASYSGDANYAAASNQTYFTIGPEEGTLSASIAGAVPLGGTLVVTISDTSTSGVGTPNVTGYVIPQGIGNPATYSVPLTGTNGVASGTVQIPATQAGSITLFVGCTSSDPNFTCYNSFDATATVNKAVPTLSLLVQPTPIVDGLPVLFTATVTGTAGQTAPTGVVIFFDNGVNIGQNGVDGTGKSTFTATGLSSKTSHSFTATYYGDSNYTGASSNSQTSTGTSASATVLTVNPNPPVNGLLTTLQASVTSAAAGVTTIPTGTVSFYMDQVLLSPVVTVNASGVATYTSTTLSSSTGHTFSAIYSGDTTYLTSTSNSVATASSGATASATVLTVSPKTPVSGTTTTLQATVASGSTGVTTVPTGSVTFYQDGTALSAALTLNAAGVGTFSSTTLNGAHIYTAIYSGDTTYKTSTSNAVTTSTGTSATTTTVKVTPNPPVSGATTTLQATIGYTPSGSAIPTGTVTFTQDGVALTPAATIASGTAVATYTSTTLSGTVTHTYAATYSGDSVYAGSAAPVVITPAASTGATASTTTLKVSAGTVAVGGAVTFTATVVSGSVSVTTVPTGIVTLTNASGTVLGSGTLVAGVATIPYTSLTAGTQSVIATYSGDTTFAASASTAVLLTTGTVAAATLSLSLNPTTVVYGGSTTATANVTGTTTDGNGPAGTVNFAVTNTITGAAVGSYAVSLTPTSSTNSVATATIPATAPGSYTVTATCTTTNISCTGLSKALGFIVSKGASTVVLTASPNPPVAGQSEVLTATISPLYGGTGTFTGYVTFYVNNVAIGTSAVNGNTATYTTTLPSPTSNILYAVYSGDVNWVGSTSSTITLAIPPTTTSSTLTPSSNSLLQGTNLILSTLVTAMPANQSTLQANPTGYVTYYDTFNGLQTMLGSATLVPTGQFTSLAQYMTTGLLAGTHTILAVFTGSASYAASTAGTTVVNVTDYGVLFSPSSATATKGQTVTALATVTTVNGFAGQVVLGCTPPSGTETTCSFSPSVLGPPGISTLTITTTKATGALHFPGEVETISFAMVMLAFLLPGVRRKRPVLLAVLVCGLMLSVVGCTTIQSEGVTTSGGGTGGSGGSGSASGTPSGTQLFTIVASGTDGRSTSRHTYQFSVTVQ